MTEKGLSRWRSGLGWLAAGCCLCAGLALVDSFVDSARTGPNTFTLLPGETESLSGPLPPQTANANDLLVTIDRPGLALSLTTERQGFWFGNPIWLGKLTIAPDTPPGEATVDVRAPAGDGPQQRFIIRIVADQATRQAASNAQSTRLYGLSPKTVGGIALAGAILAGLAVYRLSRRIETRWAQQGKAVIYGRKKTPGGEHISFGLGTGHGLFPGATVTIQDDAGRPVATATVVHCAPADATALVQGTSRIQPGAIVRRTPQHG